MIRKLIQHLTKKHQHPLLGRWSLKRNNYKENITVFNTNRDHCGDHICGDPTEHIKLSPKPEVNKNNHPNQK